METEPELRGFHTLHRTFSAQCALKSKSGEEMLTHSGLRRRGEGWVRNSAARAMVASWTCGRCCGGIEGF